jgi:TetR/AcrR family transcriptional regulator, cholesterol catabolism regulator
MKSQTNTDRAMDGERAKEIYREAARIFHEKGFDATSMDDLAQALRITKAGLYYYIDSKEDLLFRIMDHAMDWVEKDLLEPARAEADPERRLDLLVRLHARELLESGHDIPILTDEVAALTPKHRKYILQRKRVYFDLVRDTLTALKSKGKLRDVDATVATFSLFGMLLWLPRWYKTAGRLSSEQVVEHLSRIVQGGFLKNTS